MTDSTPAPIRALRCISDTETVHPRRLPAMIHTDLLHMMIDIALTAERKDHVHSKPSFALL